MGIELAKVVTKLVRKIDQQHRMKENEPTTINQNPVPSKFPFKCQKCQHDSINDKELNGFDEDDFFHAKTSFSLEALPQRNMFVVKVWILVP